MTSKYVMPAVLCLVFSINAFGEVEWRKIEEAATASALKVTGRVIAGEGGTRMEPARVQGRVINILRREGEVVEPGTPLFEINSSECTSLIEERKVAETRGLTDLLDAANRRHKQLGLEIKDDQCRMVSSYSGTIAKRQVELGAAFNIGDPLLTILDTRNLTVELEVPERTLSQVHEGQPVQFSLAANPDRAFSTSIAQILPTMDSATRTSKVRLRATPLPKHTTLDSLVFAEIIGGSGKGLLRVPASAFVFNKNNQYLIKRAPSNPVAVQVEVVNESEAFSVIRVIGKEELKPGDEIAVKGAIFLFNKMNSSDS